MEANWFSFYPHQGAWSWWKAKWDKDFPEMTQHVQIWAFGCSSYSLQPRSPQSLKPLSHLLWWRATYTDFKCSSLTPIPSFGLTFKRFWLEVINWQKKFSFVEQQENKDDNMSVTFVKWCQDYSIKSEIHHCLNRWDHIMHELLKFTVSLLRLFYSLWLRRWNMWNNSSAIIWLSCPTIRQSAVSMVLSATKDDWKISIGPNC